MELYNCRAEQCCRLWKIIITIIKNHGEVLFFVMHFKEKAKMSRTKTKCLVQCWGLVPRSSLWKFLPSELWHHSFGHWCRLEEYPEAQTCSLAHSATPRAPVRNTWPRVTGIPDSKTFPSPTSSAESEREQHRRMTFTLRRVRGMFPSVHFATE